jgi:hypothetical protein
LEILDFLAIESNSQKHEFAASTYSCSSSEFAGPRLGFHDCGACEIKTKNYSKPFFFFACCKVISRRRNTTTRLFRNFEGEARKRIKRSKKETIREKKESKAKREIPQ